MNNHPLTKMANVFYRVSLTIINGECGLMKSLRKARIFNVPCEGWFKDLTLRLVHGIIAQAFARWASVPTPMVVLLFIGKGFAGWSSRPLSIISIIYLFRGWLGDGRWTSLPSMTQLPLQLADFTLHVSVILCMGNMTLPLRLTFTGMSCVHTSLTAPFLFEAPALIAMLRTPWLCLM